MPRQLSISLTYRHPLVGAWPLGELAKGEGVVAFEHLDGDGFYEAEGALSMAFDRVHCFLNTRESVDLHTYVDFLIGALVGVTSRALSETLEAWRPDPLVLGWGGVVGALMQDDGSLLLLTRRGETLSMHYLDPWGDAPDARGSPYFTHVKFSVDALRDAALEALAEYFVVLEQLIDYPVGGELHEQLKTWRALLGEVFGAPARPKGRR